MGVVGDMLRQFFAAVSGKRGWMTVDKNGVKRWYDSSGQLHRTDGPAIERTNGDKFWLLNNRLHRTDGPAVERSNGTKGWYLNGKLHRLDGPAVERSDGTKEWRIEDKELTEQEFNVHPQVRVLFEKRRAEEEAVHRCEVERMHKILGATVRDFHKKIRQP